MYKFDDKAKLPKSVLDRKERELAMTSLKDGVRDAVSEIEKPLEKIVVNLAKDSRNRAKFEKDLSFITNELGKHVKTQDEKFTTVIDKTSSRFSDLLTSLKDQYKSLEIESKREKTVTVENISDIIIPKAPSKFSVKFDGKQEVYGKIDTGLEFPPVQVVKFETEPKPPVINITENIIKFPPVQVVKLKDKIPAPIIKVEQKKIIFPPIQKVQFDKIPEVKIKNLQKEIKINNLKDIKLNVPDKFKIDNLPIGKGYKPSVRKADPETYVPVRLTNGKEFLESLGSSGGGTIMGGGTSSLPQEWTNTSGTISTSSSLLLGSNDMRVSATLTNDSDGIIYLAFGEDAVLHTGIRLNQYGGSYEIGSTNHFKGNVFAITETGSKNVCVLEVSKKI